MIDTSPLRRRLLDLAVTGRLTADFRGDATGRAARPRAAALTRPLNGEGRFCRVDRENVENGDALPPGWRMVRLSEVCSSIADGDHQAPPQTKTGVPFLVISNVASGAIDFTNTRFVNDAYFRSLSENRVARKGDVLVTVTGSYGIAVPVNTDRDFCFQRHIAVLKPNGVDQRYLVYALQATASQKYFNKVATGTAQKTIGLAPLRNTPLPLPPLSEQKEIVRRLEGMLARERGIAEDSAALDALVAAAKRKILQLAVSGRLIGRGDRENVEREATDRTDGRAARPRAAALTTPLDGEDCFCRVDRENVENGDALPTGWRMVRLGNIAETTLGKMARC